MVITGWSSWLVIIGWSNWIVITGWSCWAVVTGWSSWIVITGRSNWIVMRVQYCWIVVIQYCEFATAWLHSTVSRLGSSHSDLELGGIRTISFFRTNVWLSAENLNLNIYLFYSKFG